MSTNDTFTPLRKSLKVKNVQPVEVVQYWAGAGNLPRRYTFSISLLKTDATYGLLGQRFKATTDALKAIGVYIQTSKFRPHERTGTLRLTLYEWNGGTPVEVPGGIVQSDVSLLKDLEESIFEFDNAIEENLAGDPVLGTEYFFTMTVDDGYKPNLPISVANSSSFLDDGMAYKLDYDGSWKKIEPYTNIVFQTYKSIASLAVEVVGPKGKSLSDIYDALTTGSVSPIAEYGDADFLKPYAIDDKGRPPHYQLFIDDTATATGSGGSVSGVWSESSDLIVALRDMFDLIQIETTERVRVDWAMPSQVTKPVSDQVNFVTSEPARTYGIRYINTATGNSSDTSTPVVANNIYEWDGDSWVETPATEGLCAWIEVSADLYVYESGVWAVFVGSSYDTLDCSTNFRLLAESDVLTFDELTCVLRFRLHATGDTPPLVSITVWKTVPPDDEEEPE